MDRYSGPVTQNEADQRAAQKPSNFPRVPSLLYSLNALWLQLRKPYASFWGFPPHIVMKVKENTMKIRMTLPPDSQNSASPKTLMARMLRIL